ncbi:DDE family transposase [Mucilaginibacter gracilis]|uniref:DDE family transposase n=1 Tax=Mucilaginibacter gracilis TaxID=423350 RepID=A0A495J7V6_9SPHI|nr:IS4 family transposase [Mucilaginibacter gracilis]RKR84099.1 DDE family transposase [Mucilaginibacter gracilis]
MSVNIKIINDLKNFITESATQTELRELFTHSKTDFSRDRKLGFERLVLLLINFFRKSYSVEIAEFYNWLDIDDLIVSKSAFCQQRMKIKDLFFACLNEVLVQSFYEHYRQDIKRWNGMRVIAVDGSIINLIHYDEVINHFGTQSNKSEKKFPMGQALAAYDILNGIAIRTELYPVKISEQRMAQQWVQYYESDMLLIYDRGYPGFISFYLHQNKEQPQPFIMRCPLRFTYEIRDFVSSDNNDTIVAFRANKYSSDELYKHGFVVPFGSTINVRLIKVILDDGTIEVLATNLFNKKDYPQEIFKELYFMRWGIETSFSAIKNQLQLEAFSGQRVITIMQDFYITFFLSNLQAIIAKPCEKRIDLITSKRLHPYKINRNIAFGIMKNRIVDLFITHNPEKILLNLQELFIHHLEPVRHNRKYPHCRKNNKSRSKYEALTNYKRAI